MAIKETTKKIYLTDDGEEHASLEKAKRYELDSALSQLVGENYDRDSDEVFLSPQCVAEFIADHVDEINEIIQQYKFQPHDTVPVGDSEL